MTNTPKAVQTAIAAYSVNHHFWAYLMFDQLDVVYKPEIPTAATDGRYCYVGDTFCDWAIQGRVFALGHETAHVMLNDIFKSKWYKARGRGPDVPHKLQEQWRAYAARYQLTEVPWIHALGNQAADYIVNDLLIRDGIGRPPTDVEILHDSGRFPHTVGFPYVYVSLLMEKPPEEHEQPGQPGGGGAEGGSDQGSNDPAGQPQGTFDHHMDPAEPGTEAEREQEIARTVNAAIVATKHAGKAPGAFCEYLEELLKEQIPWQKELYKYMRKAFYGRTKEDWSRPNKKRLAYSVASNTLQPIMPRRKGERMGTVVLQLDTSGSVSMDEARKYLTEVAFIGRELKPEELILLYVDAAVQYVDRITDPTEQRDIANRLKTNGFRGRGGTNMCAGFKWCEDNNVKPEIMVTFTDGYTGWPARPAFPTVVVTTAKAGPDYSRTLEIS